MRPAPSRSFLYIYIYACFVCPFLPPPPFSLRVYLRFCLPAAKLQNSIAIEAAIVRIMKARKTIGHPQLVAEVLSQLSFFRPNPKVSHRPHLRRLEGGVLGCWGVGVLIWIER